MGLYGSRDVASEGAGGNGLRQPLWMLETERLLDRYCGFREALSQCSLDLGMPLATAESRIKETERLTTLPIARTFRHQAGSYIRYPTAPVHTGPKKLALQIAARLDALAKREPLLVQNAMMTFVTNIQESHSLALTWKDWRRADSVDGRLHLSCFHDLVRLVGLLKVPGLIIQFEGYDRCEHSLADVRQRLKSIGAPSRTKLHLIRPANPKSQRNQEYLGLRIGCRSKQDPGSKVSASEAFRYAMALAAICKIWEFAAPKRPARSPFPHLESFSTTELITVGTTHDSGLLAATDRPSSPVVPPARAALKVAIARPKQSELWEADSAGSP
jgi:hypothetical protein